jgi:hypothetical protein
MKYKVGDKVKVKEWEDLKLEYKADEDGYIDVGVGFVDDMREFCGKELEIKKIRKHGYSCLLNEWAWEDWMFEDESKETSSIRIDESQIVKQSKSLDLETTILNLNELNTSKTRKLERLMKFIAKDYSITHDLGYDLTRETLMYELKDEDLVNEIMYHVRKGK